MSIKAKLLAAVGEVDITDVGSEALVDILVGRIKSLEKALQNSHSENARERQQLYDDHEQWRSEHKRMCTDPLYGAQGDYYFVDVYGRRYCVVLRCGRLEYIFERAKKTDIMMQQITRAEWDLMEKRS